MKPRSSAVRVPARFGPEARFEVRPSPTGLAKRAQAEKLEKLKTRLLDEHNEEAWEPEVRRFLASSANEAAAVAWLTGYPLLVFPALFEEKAAMALERVERQVEIRERSRELLAV